MNLCNNCFEEYDASLDMCPSCGYEDGDEAQEVYYLKPGTILSNRYIIGQSVGFGGFGIIYKAWDTQTNMVLAIKEYFYAALATRQEGTQDVLVNSGKKLDEFIHFKKRFLDEARCTAQFNTVENVVDVYDYFEQHQTAYMVMEFLDGIPLNELMKTQRLTLEDALSYTNQIIDALVNVHKINVIHRDISPDNVYLMKNGKIKVYDFGAARLSMQDNELTKILKPGFAPQEQYCSDRAQGPWTDIYAIGATAYYMLTGTKPVESTSRKSVSDDPLPTPKSLNSKISDSVNNAILRAMSIEIHLRFQNLDEFKKALNGKKVVRDVVAERKRRQIKRVLSLLVASLILFSGIFVALNVVLDNLQNVTLPDTEIEIWCELPEDERLASVKKSSMEQIISTFNSSYSNVDIEIQYFDSDSYYEAIVQAYEDDSLPTLFESSNVENYILEKTLSVENAIDLLSENEKVFFDFYEDCFDSYEKFPTGFIIEIKYTNVNLTQINDETSYETEKDQFLNFDLIEYYGTSADYMDIQNTLPAQFSMDKIDETQIQAEYTDFWSIGDCDDDEYKSATRLLAFFMSDNAQDYLHIQYFNNTLPLNYQTLTQSYITTFDDFSYFFEDIDEIVFS